MTVFASENFVASFDALVKKGYQGESKLRNTIRLKSGVKGSTHQFPKINKGLATRRIPITDVTPMNVVQSNVVATLEDWNAPDYVAVEDLAKLNYDERQELVQTANMAIGRRLDQQILDAMAVGANSTQVTKAVGGTDTGFNIAKVLRAKRLMDDEGVPAENRHFALSPAAIEQALNETKFASADFNTVRALAEGTLNAFAGFKFHMIETRTEGGVVLTSTTRNNFAWHKDAVGLAIGIDFNTKVDWIAEKVSHLVNVIYSAGAIVIDDNGVFDVLTHEA